MAKTKIENYENKTGTELELLQSLEQSFKKSNGASAKRNTAKSLEWFRKNVSKNFGKVRIARLQRDKSMWKSKMRMGRMYMYAYQAKTPNLPIFDKFPLMIPFSSYTSKAGAKIIVGLNFHYLQPKMRMIAFKALLKFRNEKRYRKNTRFDFDWQVISALSTSKYFKHAVHAYDEKQFRSSFIEIPAPAWELVLFLQTARWVGGNNKSAWKL